MSAISGHRTLKIAVAHGDTPEEAFKEVDTVRDMLIEKANEKD